MKEVQLFSFKLNDDFVAKYVDKEVPWGFPDAGGNSVGEITFMRSYSRKKEDGTKESWVDVCRRVIEGMYSIQKDHVKENRLPWSGQQAQASAQEAFDRLFNLKWCPPGRGLWMMGTPFVMEQKNSAALQNCAFISTKEMTKNDPSYPFRFLMEASMLGVGVGFDSKAAAKDFTVYQPSISNKKTVVIEDSREGWVNSVGALIDSFLKPEQPLVVFDYNLIRGAGEPIKGFGGVSSGPGPLMMLHTQLSKVFSDRVGQKVDSRLLADIGNLIGVCVVSGNVRRSAELYLGEPDDEVFMNLKNSSVFPERNYWSASAQPEDLGWGWMSNNSLYMKVGSDYSPYIEAIKLNGEPGFVWMDITRAYGRLVDPADNKDWRVEGFNPCVEQPLESGECCTLVETFINRHESLEDYLRTLKFAYLYGKTVTLLPTHWPQTNAIMQRNRRIGTSVSGVAEFADTRGVSTLVNWFNKGYDEVSKWDRTYSEWLCVRESIRKTTGKPSGSVSLVAGATPGFHWGPGGQFCLRSIRFAKTDPMVGLFVDAGYRVEDAVTDSHTSVVYFPVKGSATRADSEVSIFEKTHLASIGQRYWSDNSISVTVSFDPETEGDDIARVLNMYEGQLKSISFLPRDPNSYPQMPYTQITEDEYNSYVGKLEKIDFSSIYQNGVDALGEKFCSNDVCEIPSR